MRTLFAAFIVYALGAVATFGYAYTSLERDLPGIDRAAQVSTGATFISMAWPLYWSVQLARKAQP